MQILNCTKHLQKHQIQQQQQQQHQKATRNKALKCSPKAKKPRRPLRPLFQGHHLNWPRTASTFFLSLAKLSGHHLFLFLSQLTSIGPLTAARTKFFLTFCVVRRLKQGRSSFLCRPFEPDAGIAALTKPSSSSVFLPKVQPTTSGSQNLTTSTRRDSNPCQKHRELPVGPNYYLQ